MRTSCATTLPFQRDDTRVQGCAATVLPPPLNERIIQGRGKRVDSMINNEFIAERLLTQARHYAGQRTNLYRVRAYRRAAEVVALLPNPVAELVKSGGRKRLERLPGIGRHLAEVICHFVATGEWKTFDELRPFGVRPL